MSLINVTNLTFTYDGSYDNLFENVSFQAEMAEERQPFSICCLANTNIVAAFLQESVSSIFRTRWQTKKTIRLM